MKPAIRRTSCVTLNINQFLIQICMWREIQGPLRLQRLRTGKLESDYRGVRELRGNLLLSMGVLVLV